MNPNKPPTNDDDLPDERELAALYARLPKSEPDSALDAAVLAQATRGLPVRRRPRWPVALGSAAVLVLAVGVAWQVRDTHPEATATLPAPTSGKATSSAEQMVTPAPAPQADIGASAKPKAEAQTVPPIARNATSGHVLLRTMRPSAAPVPVASEPPTPLPAAMPSAAPAAPAVGRASRYMPKLDLDPDDRVGEIRRLLDSGQREQALRRLRDLRERYPHYELPQDLRDLTP